MVLLAYDGSDDAAAAIKHAGELCAARPALVVNVWRPIADQADAGLVALPAEVVEDAVGKIDGAAREASEALALEGVALAQAAGFEAEGLALRGTSSVAAELLRAAGEHQAQLIAVGARGLSGVASAMLGSVATAVTHRSETPVLITPGRATAIGDDAPAVLCYDGSEDARAALTGAGSLLSPRDAIVVSVWETEFSFALRRRFGELTDVVEDVAEEVEKSSAERARATAEEGAQLVANAGLETESMPVRAISKGFERDHATVWRTIVDTAEERDAAIIVVGARGLSRMRGALLGSVSTGVVTHAARSVLIVPHGGG